MNESLVVFIGLSFAAGMALGMFFFGGLWWTIQSGVSSTQPALWFFVSRLLRTAVVMLGFYFLPGDDWVHLLAGLAGFMVARIAVMRFTRTPGGNSRDGNIQAGDALSQENSHAP